MSTNDNFLLGLSALAGHDDAHYGAGIIAVERLKQILGCSAHEQAGLDRRVADYATKALPVEPLLTPDIPPSEASRAISEEISLACPNLHFIAHDLIIGTSALIALNELDHPVDRRLVAGIQASISGMAKGPPGIFHKLDSNRIKSMEDAFTAYDVDAGEVQLVGKMMDLLTAIKKSGLGFGFRAQEYHVVTHTHAMVWLNRNGYSEIYRKAQKPWFFRMSLLESLIGMDENEFRPAAYAEFKLGSPAFWNRIDGLGIDPHIFKTTFSLLELKAFGLLTEADLEFFWTEKAPYWFSVAENEF